MNPHIEPALLAALDALKACRLEYALVGGLAVGVWARPRATDDIDLWADLRPQVRPKLAKALTARGFDVPDMAGELEHFGVFRSLHRRGEVFLDIFDAGNPLGLAILAHRVPVKVFGRKLWMVRAEELAVMKAVANREKDFEDLVAVLRNTRVDERAIIEWTVEIDRGIESSEVTDRFRRALRTAHPKRRRR
jgi:hypothetical protein